MVGLAILAHGCTARSLVVSGVGLVALSFALTGHVASAPPRWLTGPAVTVHALCAGFWVGAFVPLLWGLRRADLIALLRRFSYLATVAVGGLLVTGAALAWIQLGGRPEALLATDYGWRLLLKLTLVLMLLAIALVNRLDPHTRDRRRPETRASWLGRTLTMDIVLAIAVLGVTATFPPSPPPRSAAVAEEGVTITAPGRGGQATITLHPGTTGPNRLEAMVVDRDGLPIVARSAELSGRCLMPASSRCVSPPRFPCRAWWPRRPSRSRCPAAGLSGSTFSSTISPNFPRGRDRPALVAPSRNPRCCSMLAR